ncbi:hypothetical protein TAMA11512_16860 [Selenomonas sp. TAMA-11512]|uniref:extracellular solute-binding protein n=1 Tax=Selenomonas sp. TAMA-11512 TaxID=3095337 RepID=UPI00308FA0A9|nr:hypothetical protein TAMA11512_16860 [Selenomonas sp. TAMA-11512]
MKKILLFLSLFCPLFFTGCFHTSNLNPNRPVTLTMWHVYGSQKTSPLNDVIDEFNRTKGKEKGVLVNVVSVSDSAYIDQALTASLNKAPGAAPLPNLFTAYPRVYSIFPSDSLLAWDDYLSREDLDKYTPAFIEEGQFDGHLYLLPIAKSTDILLLNKTIFDRFAAAKNISTDVLRTFEGFFSTAEQYYDWTQGQHMFQINDYYNYFLLNTESVGGHFFKDDKFDLHSEAFRKVYMPAAHAIIYGGLSAEKGYATDRWKTAEIIGHLGSTAGIMYLREYVTYRDNSRESIHLIALPYPHFSGGTSYILQRGTGLYALKNEDEALNEAAAIFGKWIGEPAHNLAFVTNAGYVPVQTAAAEQLFQNVDAVEQPRCRTLYHAMLQMYQEGAQYMALPRHPNLETMQHAFERDFREILHQKHLAYIAGGRGGDERIESLALEALAELQKKY